MTYLLKYDELECVFLPLCTPGDELPLGAPRHEPCLTCPGLITKYVQLLSSPGPVTGLQLPGLLELGSTLHSLVELHGIINRDYTRLKPV